MKPILCKQLPSAKPWRVSFASKAKAWPLHYSRRPESITTEGALHQHDDDPYSRDTSSIPDREQRRLNRLRLRRGGRDPSPGPSPSSDSNGTTHNSTSHQPSGNGASHTQHASNNGTSSHLDITNSSDIDTATVQDSTDRSLLVNWGRSRSRSAGGRTSRRRPASPSPEPRHPAASSSDAESASQARLDSRSGPADEPVHRGRTLRRRQERHPSPAAEAAPATVATAGSSYRSPSRHRSPSPPIEGLDEMKRWLAKDSRPSSQTSAAVDAPTSHTSVPSRHLAATSSPGLAKTTTPAVTKPPTPTAGSALAGTTSGSSAPARHRSRSRSRSRSPARDATPDPELEQMKLWLKSHEDDPLEVKPFELVARGHSPSASRRATSPDARASAPAQSTSTALSPPTSDARRVPAVNTSHTAAATPPKDSPQPDARAAAANAVPAKEAESNNGVLNLSALPASHKHHVREVDVEDLPQTHEDYGRALKEVTEVTSVMGWAKAQKHDEHHEVEQLPVVVPMVGLVDKDTSLPEPTASGGALSNAELQATVFTCLAGVAAAVSAASLLSPEFLLQLCFGGSPTALEATLTRVVGSGVIVTAVCNLCLKDASSHKRLGSATYQRLMGAGVWQALTCGAVLLFHVSLCTPVLLSLTAPLVLAGLVANCGVLSAASGSPLPPPITLATPTNTSAVAYTLLSASLLLSAAACLAPLGLIHGSITLHLPVLHHLCAPGLLAAGIVACVLQDAANRDRLGASTFKALNLGMAGSLGVLALSLGAALKDLLIVPTMLTMPVMGVTGLGAVICLIMFGLSKKKSKTGETRTWC